VSFPHVRVQLIIAEETVLAERAKWMDTPIDGLFQSGFVRAQAHRWQMDSQYSRGIQCMFMRENLLLSDTKIADSMSVTTEDSSNGSRRTT